MSKYNSMKFWKESTARTPKECQICNKLIKTGEIYYREKLTDPRINFIGKKICSDCYEKIIQVKSRRIN